MQCNSRSGNVVTIMLTLNGPAPTLVYALICSEYVVPGDNPSTVPISVSAKLTSDAKLLTLYCTSYFMMIPLGVSGDVQEKMIDLDWITMAVGECGAVGPKTYVCAIFTAVTHIHSLSCPDNPVTGSLNSPVPLTFTAATSTE